MPSSSERQRKFMCAELGRKRAGKTTKTGMREATLRELCRKPIRKTNPSNPWYVMSIRTRHGRQFVIGHYGATKRRGVRDVSGPYHAKERAISVKEMFDARSPQPYTKNPHLTGKWRFVGMFHKRDIGSVKRILRVHGMKVKVTSDHVRREKSMKELYVEKGAFMTAYQAITRLFKAVA